jgi:hypothetical protein
MLLNNTSFTEPEQRLDDIYICVLRGALREDYSDEERDEVCNSLRTLLGTIAILFSSLSAPSLVFLLCLQVDVVLDTMRNLHSIFDISDGTQLPIRPQHNSVRDFLLNRQRCTDLRFWVNGNHAHLHLLHQCLQLMDKTLRQDICGLLTPNALANDIEQSVIDEFLPPQVQYVCLYWVQHLEHSNHKRQLEAPLIDFMQRHFLHWLEALSLLQRLGDGVKSTLQLSSLYVGMLCRCSRHD